MKKPVKIILIIAVSLFALIGAFIVLLSVYVFITEDDKTIPDSSDPAEEVTEYLYDSDIEDNDIITDDDIVTEDEKTIPDSNDLAGGITDYLYGRDEEKNQALMTEAMDRKYPVNWPMLWIVVKRVNLDAQDPDGNIRHYDIEMTDEETDYLLYEMPERFADTIYEYTKGLVNVEITPLLYDEVNYMEFDDDGYSLSPESYPDI